MNKYQIAVIVGSLRKDSFKVGAIGTALVQQHLRNVLAPIWMYPRLASGQPEAFIQTKKGLFDESGTFGAGSRAFLQSWRDRYVAWVKRHSV